MPATTPSRQWRPLHTISPVPHSHASLRLHNAANNTAEAFGRTAAVSLVGSVNTALVCNRQFQVLSTCFYSANFQIYTPLTVGNQRAVYFLSQRATKSSNRSSNTKSIKAVSAQNTRISKIRLLQSIAASKMLNNRFNANRVNRNQSAAIEMRASIFSSERGLLVDEFRLQVPLPRCLVSSLMAKVQAALASGITAGS